jgi:hypothetical protein
VCEREKAKAHLGGAGQARREAARRGGRRPGGREAADCEARLTPRLEPTRLTVRRAGIGTAYHAYPDRYFRVMMPDTPVIVCRACGRMFTEEDFEMEYLKKPECPFCRYPGPCAVTSPTPCGPLTFAAADCRDVACMYPARARGAALCGFGAGASGAWRARLPPARPLPAPVPSPVFACARRVTQILGPR